MVVPFHNKENSSLTSRITGQLLLAGIVAHFQLINTQKPFKVILAVVLFSMAIIATKDRTSILSMSIIILILFYRSGFSASPFLFRIKKGVIFVVLVSIFSSIIAFQYQNTNIDNYQQYKSTFNRVILWIRSYELSKEVFPFGSGPGTQTYLMYNQSS